MFPLHADARSLPFAAEFFDAIIAVDCYSYFGTDDLYLNYLVQFVKPGGPIGIAGAGLVEEIAAAGAGASSRTFWTQDFWATAFGRLVAATLGANRPGRNRSGRHDDGRLEAVVALASISTGRINTGEIEAIEADAGRHM